MHLLSTLDLRLNKRFGFFKTMSFLSVVYPNVRHFCVGISLLPPKWVSLIYGVLSRCQCFSYKILWAFHTSIKYFRFFGVINQLAWLLHAGEISWNQTFFQLLAFYCCICSHNWTVTLKERTNKQKVCSLEKCWLWNSI